MERTVLMFRPFARAARVLAVVASAAGLLTLSLSCFSPKQPGCAFSCASDGLCPSGYACGGDGVCHRNDGQGTCDIPPQTGDAGDAAGDAEADAGAPD